MKHYSCHEIFQGILFFLKMFQSREYQITMQPWMRNKEIFKKKYKKDMMNFINGSKKKGAFVMSFEGKDKEGQPFIVIVVKKIIKPTAEIIIKSFKQHKYNNVFFLCDDAIKSSIKFLFQNNFMKKYEIFTITDIIIQPKFHKAQFKINQCSYQQIQQYLGDKDLTKYSLSKIKKEDSLLKYYGFTDGYIQYTNICQDGAYVEFKEIC